jgi:hypothetical protein
MVSEQFIWCRNCDKIHHITKPDKCLNSEITKPATDDWRTFRDQHSSHNLEPLIAAGGRYFPTGKKTDPMAVAYIEVTNGRDRYLLQGARKSIGQPLQFALIKGRLADAGFRLQIQEAAIRKAMKHHFDGAQFADEKIDGFISLVREVVTEIEPSSLRVSGYSATDSNVAYGQMGETEVDALMAKCAVQFEDADVESIRRFVEAHRENSAVMAVLMRRHVAIEQPRNSY